MTLLYDVIHCHVIYNGIVWDSNVITLVGYINPSIPTYPPTYLGPYTTHSPTFRYVPTHEFRFLGM
jgi:hypothetical protein